MEVKQFLKAQIKGKSRSKTDVYYDILFDLIGFNTVLWFDSICRTHSIHHSFILMLVIYEENLIFLVFNHFSIDSK